MPERLTFTDAQGTTWRVTYAYTASRWVLSRFDAGSEEWQRVSEHASRDDAIRAASRNDKGGQ